MPEVDYLIIDDSEVEPGAPILSTLGVRWRDNPTAIAQGASGAPRIEEEAMDDKSILPRTWADCSAGTYVVASDGLATGDSDSFSFPSEGATDTEVQIAHISCPVDGQFQAQFRADRGGSGADPEFRVYRNGSQVWSTEFRDNLTTVSKSLSCSKGDVFEVRVLQRSSGNESGFLRWWRFRTGEQWMAWPVDVR